MSAGVVQLVALGAQDVFLTGSPEVSYFVSNYKRHTNFSHFKETQVITGNPRAGGMSTVRLERYGDLVNYMYLTVSVGGQTQSISDWTQVIESCELLVGGQVIDTQDSVFTEQIAVDTLSQTMSKSYMGSLHGGLGSSSYFYPFRFFFCEAWQSALPLVALQYHDVELRIQWASTLNASYQCHVETAYVSLDNEEREKFTAPRDMLIFQVQKALGSQSRIQEINFNHPVKFLASSNVATNPLVSVSNKLKMEVNGTILQDYKVSIPHYTGVQSYYHTDFSAGNTGSLFLLPFCLNTTKLQPTGSLNFSRIDSFRIHSDEVLTQPVYGVNYNILRIRDGMGGLMFSN